MSLHGPKIIIGGRFANRFVLGGSFVSFVQATVIREDGSLIKKMPPEDCPIGNPIEHFLG